MDMERINENTIRVLIGNDDLAARGITFLDLLGNHKQIENFFYSILEEVDVEEQFEETDAVTFQVLPNRDGLELFISKNAGVNEPLDFSGLAGAMSASGFEGNEDYTHQERVEDKSLLEGMEYSRTDEESGMPVVEIVLLLQSFEDMVQLAQEVYLENAVTNLYGLDHHYFLDVIFYAEDQDDRQIDDDIAQLLEFGRETTVTPEILGEYGKLLMNKNALETTRYFFSHS